MTTEDVVKEYHKYYPSQSFDTFSQNCENYYVLGLTLYSSKENVLSFLKIKFETHIATWKRQNKRVIPTLESNVRATSHYNQFKPLVLDCVLKFIKDSELRTWDKDWWQYARVFAKSANNTVPLKVTDADPQNVLQILTSCSLFPDHVSQRAYSVIEIRNSYAHMPSLQIDQTTLNTFLYVIGQFEDRLKRT